MITLVRTLRPASTRIMRALITIALSAAALMAPVTASADCNPPCRHGKVCRYDSTHNPQFYCHKPPVTYAAPASPTTPGATKQASPPATRAAAQNNAATTPAEGAQHKQAKWELSEMDAAKNAKAPARP